MESDQQKVLAFWFEEIDQSDWYVADPALDQTIRQRFLGLWETAWEGGLQDWLTTPEGTLAYLIVTDQFSRNMFRGDARSFATDEAARFAARMAIVKGFDLALEEPKRIFFYMPFEHSEDPADQHWSVMLIEERIQSREFYRHALAHREVIRRFGRFPYRNQALGRQSTEAEEAFLAAGGYGSVTRELAG
ncbi:MAG: DUF924 family protein [Paracoccaceae bacterium]